MKQNKMKIAVAAMFFALCVMLLNSNTVNAESGFQDLSQDEIVADMGAGWNLGNQLEASIENGVQGETVWGNPTITKAALTAVKNAGFNTVRIPVSWLAKIGPAPNYTIDSSWLNRVQEVVDYAIDQDMYVILDLHNDGSISVDGSWILTNASDQAEIKNKLGIVWGQIASRFADYDEHLIFESMNEIGAESGNSEAEIRSAIDLINQYNQVIVDSIRQSGGNNNKRWILVPGWSTNIDYTAGDYGFTVPTDNYRASSIPSSQKRIMISVHYYTPWEFAGQLDGEVTRWGDVEEGTITWANETYMKNQFKKMYDAFVTNGYPVVIGEYGAVDKAFLDSKNADSRAYFAHSVCKYSKEYGCVPVYWDNGSNGDYGMALFNRQNGYSVTQARILGAIMYYYGSESSAKLSMNSGNLSMELGDSPEQLNVSINPSSSKDWIEYSSSNEAVATVDHYGRVAAKGIGTAVITASINGDSVSCNVTVSAPSVCRLKLYMQNSANWTTSASDAFVSVTGNGTYTLSISGTREEMSSVTLLYIQDVVAYLGASSPSKINSANIQVNSVKVNGQSCTLSGSSSSYNSSSGGLYINLINTWGQSCIQNITPVSGSDGVSFSGINYQDDNTLQVEFALSNVVLANTAQAQETILFEGNTTSYSTADAAWLMDAADNDTVNITYKCTVEEHAGWGILGWGATVDGEWADGTAYTADSSNPLEEKTVSVSVAALKNSLGITGSSNVTYLSLSGYNGGVLTKLSISSND